MDNPGSAAHGGGDPGRTTATVAGRLLAAMSDARPYAVPELLSLLPHLRAATVAVELKRLVESGRLARVGRGVYEALPVAPTPTSPRRPSRDWVDTRPPGARFSVYDAMAAVGGSYAAADRFLRSRSREGRLLRLGGGLYAVPSPVSCGLDDAPRPKSRAIRSLMASEARDWTAREIQDRLGSLLSPSSAPPLLGNMVRKGTVERVSPGVYRLAAGRSASARGMSIDDLTGRLDDILAGGGLWRVSDLVASSGASRSHVEDALRRMSGSGRAVYVVLNHWRSGSVSVDLARDGRTLLARALGVLLGGEPVSNAEIARRLGVTSVAVTPRMRTLLLHELATETGKGVYRCPQEIIDTVAPLLAPPTETRAA